jgi:hypothetical protein
MTLIYITGQADYDAVRGNISVSLSEANLPNSLITLQSFAGQAELWVSERTLNTDLNTPAGQHAKQAAIYYCAALLVKKVPQVKSESLSGSSYSVETPNLDTMEVELYGLASIEVSRSEALNQTITEPVDGDTGPLGFEVARASRRFYPPIL